MHNFNFKTRVNLSIKYFLMIFFIISGVYETIYISIQYNSNVQKRANSQANEIMIIENEKNMIVNKVSGVLSDILYLADVIDVNSFSYNAYSEITSQWMAFLDRKKIYNKISYYGLDGNIIETIYSEDGSFIAKTSTPDEDDLELLKSASALKPGQVFISKMIPAGHGKPDSEELDSLIQFATPLYNADNAVKGVVVADYYLQDMLDNFVELSRTSNGTVYLLDADGFSISGSEPNNVSISFEKPESLGSEAPSTKYTGNDSAPPDGIPSGTPDGKLPGGPGNSGFGFGSRYPDAWQNIKNNLSGHIIVNKGSFNFSHVLLYNQASGEINGVEVVMNTGDWVAISAIDINKTNGLVYETNLFRMMYRLLPGQLFFFALIFAMSMIITHLFVKNKLSNDTIKYFSEHDEMTSSLNRRAGFFKLRELRNTLIKNPRNLCICYIDIDDLKQVNDVFGHEAGDELIKSIVDSIKKNIRQSDFMIRLGGDEFLLVLMDTAEKEAEEIWQRIKSEFETVSREPNRKYNVSASHGIEECKVAESCNIDSVIQKADQKMYKEKRTNKKSFKVLKDKN